MAESEATAASSARNALWLAIAESARTGVGVGVGSASAGACSAVCGREKTPVAARTTSVPAKTTKRARSQGGIRGLRAGRFACGMGAGGGSGGTVGGRVGMGSFSILVLVL